MSLGILLPCSATKRRFPQPAFMPDAPTSRPFIQVYTGALWTLASAYHMGDVVAALSAKYGVLMPGELIAAYNTELTEESAAKLGADQAQADKFERLCKNFGQVVVFGSVLYRSVVSSGWLASKSHLRDKVFLLGGSYFEQTRVLKELASQWSVFSNPKYKERLRQLVDTVEKNRGRRRERGLLLPHFFEDRS